MPNTVSAMWAAVAPMIPGLGNHLWQSTLFACAAGLLTWTLRRNQARARYWLWMTASVKFLIPFSLLVGMGTHVKWPHAAATKAAVYSAMEQASVFADPMGVQPTMATPVGTVVAQAAAPLAPPQLAHFLPLLLLAVWLGGFVVVLTRWWMRWRRVQVAVREAEPMRAGREVEMLRRLERFEMGGTLRRIEMVASRKSMEPGIFGIARPVLMWPEGISERLDDGHLEAVLAHEIWHVRRRDNLAAAMHMVVEAVFWFHPMVWWLGSRLVEERERACDEEVLALYQQPEVYAESILKVCEFCVESPLACVSGVTGSDLKKRIVHIMTEHVARKLNFGRKLLLVVAGTMAVAVPVMIGALNAPAGLAQFVVAPMKAVVEVVAPQAVIASVKVVLPMMAAVAPKAPQAAIAPTAPAGEVHAPGDISGQWQGTLVVPAAPGGKLRIILTVAKAPNGGWTALNYSIDQGARPMNTTSVTLQGNAFKFAVPAVNGTYEGILSADGNTIVGNWTQGSPLPLTFVRASKETAWEIPPPPVPPKPMAADANPTFEVATIKPSNPDQPGRFFRVNGRNFSTHNTSLAALIEFAYGIHAKQIVDAPEWVDKDSYDINAVPDGEGQPNDKQWKGMVQKLLADRFKLAFHHDKRELSVYALTVAKGEPKNLAKNESGGPLPGLFFRPTPGGVMLPAVNSTMADFAGVMQTAVLDRPVVDQTGLTGRFDFTVKWAPDDSQFNGHAPPASPSDDPPPGLFTAIQEQIGLKLDAVKAPVDVLAIDHVEKPSAN